MKWSDIKIGGTVYLKKHERNYYPRYKDKPFIVTDKFSGGSLRLEGLHYKLNAGDVTLTPCVDDCAACVYKLGNI